MGDGNGNGSGNGRGDVPRTPKGEGPRLRDVAWNEDGDASAKGKGKGRAL